MKREPVIYEDELNDWINMNVDTDGFSASISIDKWDKEEIHPKEITITLSYKTGDGADQPYSDTPPDEDIIKVFEKHGWNVETEGTMIYPHLMLCPKCGEVKSEDCVEVSEEELAEGEHAFFRHKKCGSLIEDYVTGSKWIHGFKTIQLKGTESARKIKQIIKQNIEEVI
ncbi:MAG: hypothetical protein QXT67_04795 [Candidatus Bathyarchaeia archaeon]